MFETVEKKKKKNYKRDWWVCDLVWKTKWMSL